MNILFAVACSTPSETLSWSSHDPVVVEGAAGKNLRSVPTGGAVAVRDGWRVAARLPNAVDVWQPGDTEARTVELPDYWDPGQVVISEPGRAYVVLRGAGAVLPLTLGPELAVESPIEVCEEPRGLAVDSDLSLWVACRTGELVHVEDGTVTSSWEIEYDLRDVVVGDGTLWVSRFRDAEVLRLDSATGEVLDRFVPPTLSRIDSLGVAKTYTPRVAWRMVPRPQGGGVVLLHQGHQNEEVTFSTGAPYYGPPPDPPVGTCDGIVETEITEYTEEGTTTTLPPLGVSGVIDLAFAPDGTMYVATTGAPGYSSPMQVAVVASTVGDCSVLGPVQVQGADVGSAIVVDASGVLYSTAGAEKASRPFYELGSAMISCASCHPDGGEDGHTWRLQATGGEPRRTISVGNGLLATAPYHWAGDLHDLDALWSDVAVTRMGKPIEATGDLGAWLDELPAPAPHTTPDPTRVERGATLFADPVVGCATCHVPPTFQSEQSRNVATGGEFQVPSLIGISARLPTMHDGCAETLMDRFTDTACGGGDHHGVTSHLTSEDLASLVAFLETL